MSIRQTVGLSSSPPPPSSTIRPPRLLVNHLINAAKFFGCCDDDDDDDDEGTSNGSSAKSGKQEEEEEENEPAISECRRRHLLLSPATAIVSSFLPIFSNKRAIARGLVQFPVDDPNDMLNTYHFLRVGETLLESDDILSTNPLFLTNREAALTSKGQEQIQEACSAMEKANSSPGVIKYSLAASAIDSANIVSSTMNVGRERVVPEFTYLDPRGIGKWEQLSKSQTSPAIWALDASEAGPNGTGGRPPANEDGTPNETLADQAVRLRQVMSILETLYSGETILVIFPDSTGPALLSALIAGLPLNRVHELEFLPGELRMDVTKASILQYLKEKSDMDVNDYQTTLAAGRNELSRLRAIPKEEIISLKDEKIESQRIEIDNQYNEKEAKRLAQEEADRESRAARAREIEQKQRERRLERQEQQSATAVTIKRRTLNEESDMGSDNPLIAVGGSAAVIGTVGFLAASSVSSSSGEDNYAKQKPSAEQGQVQDEEEDSVGSEQTSGSIISTEVQSTPAASYVEPVDLLAGLALADEIGEAPPTPTKEDRVEAAAKAMEEYLNKDDGGEDWLTVMSEIIDETDDSEEEEEEVYDNQVK